MVVYEFQFLVFTCVPFVNLQLECEPEFLMGDLECNPDIHEKPPIPLRDALEKAKPFLMAYENIESQQEWEV